jgi:hypothetical protein
VHRRHSRSMNNLSIHRPWPSIEIRAPAPVSTSVNRGEVNCASLARSGYGPIIHLIARATTSVSRRRRPRIGSIWEAAASRRSTARRSSARGHISWASIRRPARTGDLPRYTRLSSFRALRCNV